MRSNNVWQSSRRGWRLVDSTGRIIGRVSERPYPMWDEYIAEANEKDIGTYDSATSAKTAVENAVASTPAQHGEQP